MSVLYWLTAAAALLGVWLNIRKHVACFYLWTVTNAIWAVADYTHGLVQQAVVQVVYFALSLYGIRCWSSRTTMGPSPRQSEPQGHEDREHNEVETA